MPKETKEYARLLTLLLEGSVIANFEYWSEFIIRIQRDEAQKPAALREWFGERRIPSLFCLRLRAKWWIGELDKWMVSVQQFPIKAVPPLPKETAIQASTLIMLLGSEILKVDVDENSCITVVLSGGQVMTVQGTNGEWEESWFLELPVDDRDRDQWSIVCDSNGLIAGKYPGSVTEKADGLSTDVPMLS